MYLMKAGDLPPPLSGGWIFVAKNKDQIEREGGGVLVPIICMCIQYVHVVNYITRPGPARPVLILSKYVIYPFVMFVMLT